MAPFSFDTRTISTSGALRVQQTTGADTSPAPLQVARVRIEPRVLAPLLTPTEPWWRQPAIHGGADPRRRVGGQGRDAGRPRVDVTVGEPPLDLVQGQVAIAGQAVVAGAKMKDASENTTNRTRSTIVNCQRRRSTPRRLR